MAISTPTTTVITFSPNATAADSKVIDMRNFRGGEIIWPSSINSATTVAFHVAGASNGTFVIARDSSQADLAVVPAIDRADPLPEALFANAFLKVVPDATITGAVLILKS